MFIADELDLFELPAQAWSIKCTHPFFKMSFQIHFALQKCIGSFMGNNE